MTKKQTIAVALLAVAAGGAYWLNHTGMLPALKRASPTQQAAPIAPAAAVTVVRAEPRDFVKTLLVTGTLVPREEILVGPQIEGLRIVEVLAEEGDKVKQGQVLARLVNDTIEAQLAQNTAGLAKASAAIQQARSNIVSAEAKLVEAKNTFDRGKPLRQQGYISEAVQDTREAAAKTAQAALNTAKDGLALAEADKAQIEAQRKDLEWRMGRTEITAPTDGIVSRRVARIGGFAAGNGDPMFRIIAKGEIELDAEVPETQIVQLRPGHVATIEVPGVEAIPGKVRLVSPEIDRASRLGRTRISVDSHPALRIGSFAHAIVTTDRSRGIAVPSSALQHGERGSTVQLVTEDRIVVKPVKVGISAGPWTEIRDGVAENDVVVARSGTFLREGDAVRPIFESKRTEQSHAKNESTQ